MVLGAGEAGGSSSGSDLRSWDGGEGRIPPNKLGRWEEEPEKAPSERLAEGHGRTHQAVGRSLADRLNALHFYKVKRPLLLPTVLTAVTRAQASTRGFESSKGSYKEGSAVVCTDQEDSNLSSG